MHVLWFPFVIVDVKVNEASKFSTHVVTRFNDRSSFLEIKTWQDDSEQIWQHPKHPMNRTVSSVCRAMESSE